MVKKIMQKLLKYKKYLIFVFVIIIVGFVAGFIYYHLLKSNTQNDILYTLHNLTNYRYNAIIKDLTITSLLLVLAFLVIGLPLGIFYLFYESAALGFLFSTFLAAFKIKGLFYALMVFLVNRLIPLILIVFFMLRIINISRYVIGLFIYKKDQAIISKIMLNFKNSLYLLVFLLLYNIFLYFVTPSIFNFLIK